jgi:hypothetical protein
LMMEGEVTIFALNRPAEGFLIHREFKEVHFSQGGQTWKTT